MPVLKLYKKVRLSKTLLKTTIWEDISFQIPRLFQCHVVSLRKGGTGSRTDRPLYKRTLNRSDRAYQWGKEVLFINAAQKIHH